MGTEGRLKLSWEQCTKLSAKIARCICTTLTPEELDLVALCVIPRGGMVFATLLAHHLNLNAYRVYTAGYPTGAYVIVVDEIADSGKTLRAEVRYVQQKIKERVWTGHERVTSATLVTRHSSIYRPTFTGLNYPGDEFIEFPWEVENVRENCTYVGCNVNQVKSEVRPSESAGGSSIGNEVSVGSRETSGGELGERVEGPGVSERSIESPTETSENVSNGRSDG